ncbi:MAG TPA: chromosome segregation protein SMC [Methanoregulaceae archaeon]|nr:chromosome segregation protein SMC [Methanoregulaceae archaeon]
MYISELEIDNFKSFFKKTKIPFFDGFTVISGPNGSGKSNIIDAILFVLALSGSRSLRAEKLTDLINLNSGKNTAEVSITFSDGTKIRRRIKRTGNGYYSYNYLNDRLCKQNDVIELLAKVGIKPHGYNVVMQGDITRIIEMSDFERRKIIDEIAGVAEFDLKRDQALSELEVVRERIEREELLLNELNQRLSELKQEREQALRYKELEDRQKFLQSARFAATIREREKEQNTVARLIADQSIELERILSDRGIEENELSYLRSDLKDIDTRINQKSGAEYLKLITTLEELRGAIKVAEQTIGRLQKDKEANLESVTRNYLDTKRAETRIAECNDAIRNLNIDRTNLAMEAASARGKFEKTEETIKNESKEAEGSRDRLFSLMKTIEEKKGARSSVIHQQDMLLEKSRMRTSERERLSERLKSIDGDIKQKEDLRNEASALAEQKNRDLEQVSRDLSGLESSSFGKRNMVEEIREEIQALEKEVVRLEAQAQARGEAGSNVLKSVLAMDGVYGTIMQLGQAPPEYALALNVAAGGKLHYVVVEDDHVAARAIQYLKDEKLGRVTFLPLKRLKKLEYPVVREDGAIDYAINLLSFNPRYRDAFGVALGGTLVFESLEKARKMIGRYRMVTTTGELLDRSGAMTGGYFKKSLKGFGAAVGEEIDRLRARIGELRDEAGELENAIKTGTGVIEEKRALRAEITQEAERNRMASEEYARQAQTLLQERESMLATISTMEDEVKTGSQELGLLEQRLDSITDEINRFNADMDVIKKRLDGTRIPALTEERDKWRKETDDLERRLRDKESDIMDLQRERQHFNNRLTELQEELAKLQDRNKEVDRETAALKQSIESSTTDILALEEKQKQFSGELEGLRSKHDEIMEHILASEKKIMEFETLAERTRVQRSALEERMKQLQEEIDSLKPEAGEVTTDMTLQEIEDGIAESGHAMRKIGAVNMLAIEEYEKVERRVGERTTRKETLSRERTTLIERIETFGKMKYEAFIKAFHAIDENFREIFATLTSGSGHLVLENEEDPFSGGLSFAVQPRDKPVHLLNALSGGEKSLTTLAFIFSIQKYVPAPFYAFDEVDMSLDGSNAERIARMIRERAETSQFIIVSLRKPMIEGADRIMGVTVRADKSSLVTGVKVNG